MVRGSVIEMLTAHCEHPADFLWLTRKMTNCGKCNASFSRTHYRELEAKAKAVDPKTHCRKWTLSDDRTRHHGLACTEVGRALNERPVTPYVN